MGRSGWMAARAARRTRVCPAFWALAPKGSAVTIDQGRSSRRCGGGKGGSSRRKRVSPRNSQTWAPGIRASRRATIPDVGPALAMRMGPRAAGRREGVVGKVGKWTLAVALLGAACAKSHGTDPGNPVIIPPDAGPVADAGPVDAGPPDAGPPDGGPPDAGAPTKFTGPGPWPIKNVEYGYADGIQEMPVIGVTTDEKQNLWVATHSVLYLMRPSDTKFRRYDTSNSDLHLPGNPAAACDDSYGTHKPCPNGAAANPGISEIVGGGPDEASKMEGEVFVGYYGHHDWNRPDDGTWTDPWMHSGKLDRVRLKPDGSLEVIRFDMVSNNSPQFWHNKTVWKM